MKSVWCVGDLYCDLTTDVFAFLVTFRGLKEAHSLREANVIRSSSGKSKDGTRVSEKSRIFPRDSLTTSTPDEFKMAPPAF